MLCGRNSTERYLTRRRFYRPPGFGETPKQDTGEEAFILELAKPITVVPAQGADAKNCVCLATFRDIRWVQL
jgi:hypothetical protein